MTRTRLAYPAAWFGLVGAVAAAGAIVSPAGSADAAIIKEIIARLYASLAKVMANEEVRQKLLAVGIEPTISKSPEEFGAFIKSQAETREKVIKAVGMKLD